MGHCTTLKPKVCAWRAVLTPFLSLLGTTGREVDQFKVTQQFRDKGEPRITDTEGSSCFNCDLSVLLLGEHLTKR